MKTAILPQENTDLDTPSFEEILDGLNSRKRRNILDNHIKIIQQKDNVIDSQQKRIDNLEQILLLEKNRHYGSSSEKLNALQLDLFNEVEVEAEPEEEIEDSEIDTSPKKKKKSRKPFSDTLPRIRVDLKLTEDERNDALRTFFTKVKEELDIIPAQARVLEYWQEKAVFEDAGVQTIKVAQRPTHPLGKTTASVRLLAYIITAKYCDALPLYRLEKILSRYGGSMTRTAMANWIIRLTTVFMPLLNLMREHQLNSNYLQADETRLQVLKEPGKSATSDKWMWLIRGGPPNQPVVTFDYDASRSAAVPSRLLEGFSGVLQTDGYVGYNQVCRDNDITRMGCWDHARRKFVDATKAIPATKKRVSKKSKAELALNKIRQLYAIEKQIKELSPEKRYEQRQKLSIPILNDFKTWLDKNICKIAKDSLTYTAMFYALNQWDTLIRYCDDGQLYISNILAENAIRPLAIGRRNWFSVILQRVLMPVLLAIV